MSRRSSLPSSSRGSALDEEASESDISEVAMERATEWGFLHDTEPLSPFRRELQRRRLDTTAILSAQPDNLPSLDNSASSDANRKVATLFQDTLRRLHVLKEEVRIEELQLAAPNMPKSNILLGAMDEIDELPNPPSQLVPSGQVADHCMPTHYHSLPSPIKTRTNQYGAMWFVEPQEWNATMRDRTRGPEEEEVSKYATLPPADAKIVPSILPDHVADNPAFFNLRVNRAYKKYLIDNNIAMPEDLRNVQVQQATSHVFEHREFEQIHIVTSQRKGAQTWTETDLRRLQELRRHKRGDEGDAMANSQPEGGATLQPSLPSYMMHTKASTNKIRDIVR